MRTVILLVGLLFPAAALAVVPVGEDVPDPVVKSRLGPAITPALQPPTTIGEVLGSDLPDAVASARLRIVLLESLGTSALDIRSGVQGGEAWLEGTVALAQQRDLAHDLATDIPGVADVQSYLSFNIRPVHPEAWRDAEDLLLEAQLQLRLLNRLGEDALDLKVTAEDGVVALRGKIRDRDLARRAALVARSHSSVLALNDSIDVVP